MSWSLRKTGSMSVLGRLMAVLAVVAWSSAWSVCLGFAEQDSDHEHVADNGHHGAGSSDEQTDDCCRILASGSPIVATAAALPAPKSIAFLGVIDSTTTAATDDGYKATSGPARHATDPPRLTPPRFTSYSPLAPPPADSDA